MKRTYIGEVIDCTTEQRVRVWASLWDDGSLHLDRDEIDNPDNLDNPTTLVTREGLLRLSQGPFDKGYVEDHL